MTKRSSFKWKGKKKIDVEYLDTKAAALVKAGYPVSKWIVFCRTLINRGYTVLLHEAADTHSKYIYLLMEGSNKRCKVRYSNHRAFRDAELAGDCDIYVGVGNLGVINTEQALVKVDEFFDQKRETNGEKPDQG